MGAAEGAEHDDEGAGQDERAERRGTRAVGSALVRERAAESREAHPGAAAESEHVAGEEWRHGRDRRTKAGRVGRPGRGERRSRTHVAQGAVERHDGWLGRAKGRHLPKIAGPEDPLRPRASV